MHTVRVSFQLLVSVLLLQSLLILKIKIFLILVIGRYYSTIKVISNTLHYILLIYEHHI